MSETMITLDHLAVRKIKEELKLNEPDLVRRTGITRPTLHRYTTIESPKTNIENAKILIDVFNIVKYSYMLCDKRRDSKAKTPNKEFYNLRDITKKT